MTPRARVLALAVVPATIVALAAVWLATSEPKQIALGRQLYADHCASCHGKNLEGQPDWMIRLPNGRLPAPPHDASGHTWHHADDELFLITKRGLAAIVADYESDMPAFDGVLGNEEIRAILAFIKSTWPERARDYQETRTRTRQER